MLAFNSDFVLTGGFYYKIIEDASQNRNEVQLSVVQGYTSLPMPIVVLASSLAIVILLCLGLIRIKVETRLKGSSFFYRHCVPFYRIEQVITLSHFPCSPQSS